MKTTNELEDNQEKTFKCEVCSKCFSYEKHLKYHIRVVHEKRYLCRCPICSKTFTQKTHLQRHIRNKHEKESFNCDLCNRSFYNGLKLKLHKASAHNKKTNFKCEICNFNFSYKNCLNVHIKNVHEQIREHVCAVCYHLHLDPI